MEVICLYQVERKKIPECLVQASNTRGDTIAAGVGLGAQGDVTAVVICIRASAGWETITCAVVATHGAACDNLNAAENGRLGADRSGEIGVRAVDIATHVSED